MRKLLNLITFGLVSEKPRQQSGKPAVSAEELEKIIEDDTKQIVENFPIKGSPITISKYQNQYYVLLGKYRLSEAPFPTRKQAEEDAKRTDWFRVMQIMRAVAQEAYNENKLNETITRQQNGKQKQPAVPMTKP